VLADDEPPLLVDGQAVRAMKAPGGASFRSYPLGLRQGDLSVRRPLVDLIRGMSPE